LLEGPKPLWRGQTTLLLRDTQKVAAATAAAVVAATAAAVAATAAVTAAAVAWEIPTSCHEIQLSS